MGKRKCGACGKDPAEGLASVTWHGVETFYCHGDDDDVSCYEGSQWAASHDAERGYDRPRAERAAEAHAAASAAPVVPWRRPDGGMSVPPHEHVTVDAQLHWAFLDLHVRVARMLEDDAVDVGVLQYFSGEAERHLENSRRWNSVAPDHHNLTDPAACWHDEPCGQDPCPEREHYLDIEDSELP